ncbi:MAG TPA: DUF3105 domain-containing protein [Anaerolineales bacterium]|nr:DUF3105 domain-containing protein [Anaerolineales bacterium]
MKNKFTYSVLLFLLITACGTKTTPTAEHVEQADAMLQTPAADLPEMTAIPNDSGIAGVEIYPDRIEYHAHVDVVAVPEGGMPPTFGEHFAAWQNCGIYDQPVELGNALHSMEHGAVWVTYRSDLPKDQVTELQDLVRGHGYVLMSPYSRQISDVVLTAWGVQLTIDSLPDDRIAKFIKYYEEGPQNPEPGAPCSGAVGNPIQ